MAGAPNPLMGAGAGGGANPMAGIIMNALAKRTQQGAATPGAAAAENAGADDGMVLQQLNKINEALGIVFVRTFQTRPNVANQISATMKALSRAIKEAGQAAQVGEAVGAQEKPPINFSAAAQGGATPETPPAPVG
jgi:hypothetical protein